MKNFEYVTIDETYPFADTFVRVTITQDYNKEHNQGHYRGYIEKYQDVHTNTIVAVFQTSNAVHKGKIDEETCNYEHTSWLKHL